MDDLRLINEAFVNTFIRKRDKELHKGDCGKVLVIAGSKGMAGAAILSARGALRSGAGLVRVMVPEELFPILQVGVPEATCVSRSLPPERLGEYQAIVIGPGLGDDLSNVPLIHSVLKCNCPAIVIDADGLNLLARDQSLKGAVKNAGERLILTPHPGEAARLLGCSSAEINDDRAGSVYRLAEQFGSVTVLKGQGLLWQPQTERHILIRQETRAWPREAAAMCCPVSSVHWQDKAAPVSRRQPVAYIFTVLPEILHRRHWANTGSLLPTLQP